MYSLQVAIWLLLSAVLLSTCSAFRCYECFYDSLASGNNNCQTLAGHKPIANCSNGIGKCRLRSEKFLKTGHIVIDRTCVPHWWPLADGCHVKNVETERSYECICNTELCNGSIKTSNTVSGTIIMVLSVLLLSSGRMI